MMLQFWLFFAGVSCGLLVGGVLEYLINGRKKRPEPPRSAEYGQQFIEGPLRHGCTPWELVEAVIRLEREVILIKSKGQ